MLAAGGGTERGEQTVANADLCIGVKRRRLVSVILPYRLNETEHALLNQILPVAAGEEKRTRTRAHHSVIARDKKLFCFPVARGGHGAQLLIRAGCKLFMMALTLMILHVLYLLCSGFVKYLRKFSISANDFTAFLSH